MGQRGCTYDQSGYGGGNVIYVGGNAGRNYQGNNQQYGGGDILGSRVTCEGCGMEDHIALN
jgi:hypothetical protein